MGKATFWRAVVALACCGSVVIASCADPSQSSQTSATTVNTTAAQVKIADITDPSQEFVFNEWTLYLLFGVNVPDAIASAKSFQDLLKIADDAKSAFSTFGAVVGGVKALISVLQALGFLQVTDEVKMANANVLETAVANNLATQMGNISNDWNQSVSGMNALNDPLHDLYTADSDTDMALGNLVSAAEWSRIVDGGNGDDAFTGGANMLAPVSLDGRSVAPPQTYGPTFSFQESVSHDTYGHVYKPNNMMWKQVVEGASSGQSYSTSFIAPAADGNPAQLQTFDWRLAAPYALKALANRLIVMGAIDPNFTTDGSYNYALGPYLASFQDRYNQMNNGVQCGSMDYVFYQGNNTQVDYNTEACAIVCADIYTGLAVLSAITPNLPLNLQNPGSLQLPPNTSATCETAQKSGRFADAVNKTAAVIRQEMPLYEMKAAIDTLYRIVNPYPSEDLTTVDGMIAPITESDVCIGAANASMAVGTPLQLSSCNANDPSQKWAFSRITGQISNVANPNLCIEMDATTQGDPATIQLCAPAIPVKTVNGTSAWPVVEIADIYQKWTYDSGGAAGLGGNILNGSGFALGWQALTSNGNSLTPAVGTGLVASVWNQGSGWIDPSSDGSGTISGANEDWRSDGPAFAPPQDISNGGELSSSPAVASQGPNELDVFWVDASNHLRQSEFNDGVVISPSNPKDLGLDPAQPGNSPAAVSYAPGRIDIVQLGNTPVGCELYHTCFDYGAWQGWDNPNAPNQPILNCNYGVAISSWGTQPGDRLDVFAVAQTGEVWHLTFDRSLGGWQPWEDRGGNVTSTPAAVSWGSGRIDMIARGTDSTIFHQAFLNGGWTGWDQLGGFRVASGDGPTIASYQPNRLDVFARDPQGELWHRPFDNTTWAPWENMGYTAPSQPIAVSWGPPVIDLFARDALNGALWQNSSQ